MMNRWKKLMVVAVTGIMLSSLAACDGTKVKEERDSLALENANLKLERDKAVAEARAQKMRADQLSARPMTMAPAVSAAPTGLELEKGVKENKNAQGEDQIEIEGDVLFDTGKAIIKPNFKQTLDKVAEVLKSKYEGRQFRVEGHTDPRPVRSSGWEDNWDLGAARARAVMLYLVSKGVPKANFYIASFADNALKSETDYAQDRRVSIVVVGLTKE